MSGIRVDGDGLGRGAVGGGALVIRLAPAGKRVEDIERGGLPVELDERAALLGLDDREQARGRNEQLRGAVVVVVDQAHAERRADGGVEQRRSAADQAPRRARGRR